ncbi:MAG: hypothetical protein ACFFBP_04615 [Promethearchaeota archaeon]
MSIIMPKEAYYTIIAGATRFANQKIPFDDWIEAYGIFTGKLEGKKKNTKLIITNAIPIMHQEKNPDDIVDRLHWKEEDYASIEMIENENFEKNEFIVGWWHSHPGFKVMLSGFGDRQTTLSYQTEYNPLGFALVFNPERLVRQIEKPNKKGDPDIKLKSDPGFKIFRFDDISKGPKGTYHEVQDYVIEGFNSREEMIVQAQKLVIDITKHLPSENIVETYEREIENAIQQLQASLLGTDEYLQTLIRKGESSRVPEVLEKQKTEIRNNVKNTNDKVEKLKNFTLYLEYKEREIIIPQINTIFARWDETISKLDNTLAALSKKF